MSHTETPPTTIFKKPSIDYAYFSINTEEDHISQTRHDKAANSTADNSDYINISNNTNQPRHASTARRAKRDISKLSESQSAFPDEDLVSQTTYRNDFSPFPTSLTAGIKLNKIN